MNMTSLPVAFSSQYSYPNMKSDTAVSFFKNNDRRNLVLVLGLFLFLAFVATMAASFFVSRGSIRNAVISRELPLTTDNIYSEIQKDILLPLYISSTMANDTFLRQWIIDGEQDLSQIQRYLAEIKEKYNTVSSFFISEKTRRYYYADGILKTVSEAEPRDEWYFRVSRMASLHEINIDPDMANRDAITIFINFRVFDFNNNYIGATGVGLTLDILKQYIRDYQERYQRNVYFVDRSGIVMLQQPYYTDHVWEGRNITNIGGLNAVADQILNSETASLEYELDGRAILLNVRYIPEMKWYLMVEQDTANIIRPLRNVLYVNIAIALAVTLIVLFTIGVMVLRFQRNLETRNLDLESKNRKITLQREQLELQTRELAEINRQLEHLNREKDEFLGIAAHDLRSPLSGIIAAVELLGDETSADHKQQMRDYIQRISTNMLDLINNLLDITAIDMVLELEQQSTSIHQVVSDVLSTFDLHARAKRISLQTQFTDEPLHVRTHRDWLPHIVGNLVSNAIKYSPEDSSVNIALTKSDAKVRLTVSDQGPGFTLEDRKNLFKRFTRLSARPTGGESSSGLGLYIVKKLTERLGGSVWCESEYGVGSSFVVELPLVESAG